MKLCALETHLGHLDATGYTHTNTYNMHQQWSMPTFTDVCTHKHMYMNTHTHKNRQALIDYRFVLIFMWTFQ